jgi:hypothetical protein
MDLRKRLSTEETPQRSGKTRSPWGRWVLFTALILLLAAPFLLDLNIPGLRCYRGKYRPAEAATGKRLPDTAAVISVSREGVVRVSSGEEMALPITTPEELHQFVENIASTFPERAFVLKIDKEIPYASVDQVLAALKAAGVHDVYFHTVLPIPP